MIYVINIYANDLTNTDLRIPDTAVARPPKNESAEY